MRGGGGGGGSTHSLPGTDALLAGVGVVAPVEDAGGWVDIPLFWTLLCWMLWLLLTGVLLT